MTTQRPLVPSREDVAADRIVRECAGRGHRFPEENSLRPTETSIGPDGQTVNHRRVRCGECGTFQLMTWDEPPQSGTVLITVPLTFEAPEPGDIPGLADRAAHVTDDEISAMYAENLRGITPTIPERPEPARPETRDLAVRVTARQFYLLDSDETPGGIIPVPDDATGAGIIETTHGAAVLWTAAHTVGLTVVVSADDPGADDGYDDIVEITYRSRTGRVTVTELAGAAYPLPPLHAGYGDHRLRYHVRDGGCLLQIWRAPRTRPAVVKATSEWASARVRITAPPTPGIGPTWHPESDREG